MPNFFLTRVLMFLTLVLSILIFLLLIFNLFSVKNLPVSDAILLNFMTPAMACFTARLINKEKLTFTDIGGMFVLFTFSYFLIERNFEI